MDTSNYIIYKRMGRGYSQSKIPIYAGTYLFKIRRLTHVQYSKSLLEFLYNPLHHRRYVINVYRHTGAVKSFR